MNICPKIFESVRLVSWDPFRVQATLFSHVRIVNIAENDIAQDIK